MIREKSFAGEVRSTNINEGSSCAVNLTDPILSRRLLTLPTYSFIAHVPRSHEDSLNGGTKPSLGLLLAFCGSMDDLLSDDIVFDRRFSGTTRVDFVNENGLVCRKG